MKTLIPTKHKTLYLTILCFLFFSFACNSVPNTLTPSIISPSVTATFTSSPTDTPAPTATVQPSATPSPTATSTPLITGLGQVIFGESFNDIGFLFNIPGPNKIESGVLILDETPEDQFANGIYGIESIPPGATTIVLFKTTAPGAKFFNIGYHNDQYGTEQLRRFSYNSNVDTWDLYEGNASTNGGNSPIKSWNASQVRSDTWYYFSITRSADGAINAKIWERDRPENLFQYQENLGSEWGSLDLTFFVDFRGGAFMIDEYQDLK